MTGIDAVVSYSFGREHSRLSALLSGILRIDAWELRLIAGLGGAVAVLAALVLAADVVLGIDQYDLVRDPNAVAGQPNYVGLVSNLGGFLWVAGAAMALQGYAAVRGQMHPIRARLLLAGGAFALLMGLDDVFMLHESVAIAGIPELVVLVPHALFLAALCRYALILGGVTPFRVLAVAVASLGMSLVVDAYPGHFGGQVFIEECFKLAGIVFLTAYLAVTAHGAVRDMRQA